MPQTFGAVFLSNIINSVVEKNFYISNVKCMIFCSNFSFDLGPDEFDGVILTVIWRQSYHFVTPFICQLIYGIYFFCVTLLHFFNNSSHKSVFEKGMFFFVSHSRMSLFFVDDVGRVP